MFSKIHLGVKAFVFFLEIFLIFNGLLIIQDIDRHFLPHVKSLMYNDRLNPDRSSIIFIALHPILKEVPILYAFNQQTEIC